jgi:hypothetical protein
MYALSSTPVAEVGGREHVVKVVGGGAEFDVGRDGRKLLRIRIVAEVDGVRSDYEVTYGRYGEPTRPGDAPMPGPTQTPRGSPP